MESTKTDLQQKVWLIADASGELHEWRTHFADAQVCARHHHEETGDIAYVCRVQQRTTTVTRVEIIMESAE